MTLTFNIHRHLEIYEEYQGINLTAFTMEVDDQMDNDRIVDTFIRSTHFSYDCLADCVKAEPNKNYLGQAFNMDNIKISDFRKTDKYGVSQFLFDYINEPDWGDDRNDFAKLLDRYFVIHNELGDNNFYILSKDWFDEKQDNVLLVEWWSYTYYMLIISVDRRSNVLTLTEWTYDLFGGGG